MHEFEVVGGAAHLLSQILHFLQIKVHLGLALLHSQTRISAHTISANLPSSDLCLQKLKCLPHAIEKHIIRVEGALCLVRILQVKHVQARQVQSFQAAFDLRFEEFRMQTVTRLLNEAFGRHAVILNEEVDHFAL